MAFKIKIIKKLKKEFPHAKCALNYKNPLELLVATILSAQCTDERVNKVTLNLANTRLLLALKLTLFRGASVNEPCDKKDVADFKKFYLLENPLQDELETIVPKVISDPQFITEIIELFTERYNRITQL